MTENNENNNSAPTPAYDDLTAFLLACHKKKQELEQQQTTMTKLYSVYLGNTLVAQNQPPQVARSLAATYRRLRPTSSVRIVDNKQQPLNDTEP